MNDINVSIIVPVYNTEKYLPECVDSLIHQTISTIEIILIDDGSTDNSSAICDEYSRKYKNVVTLHQTNQGISAARNNGISVAKGDYVLFVDSDDMIVPDACEKLLEAAKKTGADLCRGDVIGYPRQVELNEKLVDCLTYMMSAIDHRYYDIVSVLDLIRANVLKERKIRFVEGCFYEDQEYMLKLLYDRNTTIYKTAFPFYYYRSNPESATHNYSIKKGRDFIRLITIMQEYIRSKTELKDYREYGAAVVAFSVWHFKEVWTNLEKEERKMLYNEFRKKCDMGLINVQKLPLLKKESVKLFISAPSICFILHRMNRSLHKSQVLRSIYYCIKNRH